jgi:hypothetical protein
MKKKQILNTDIRVFIRDNIKIRIMLLLFPIKMD